MNSVDIAAFIANDDAEYLGDVAAIALITGTAVMLRAVERSRRNRRAHGGSPMGRKPNRDRGMNEAGNPLDRQYFCRTGVATQCSPMLSLSDGSACHVPPTKRYGQPY
jgi:hypothetical protein